MYLKVGDIVQHYKNDNNNNKYSKSTCNVFFVHIFQDFHFLKIKLVCVPRCYNIL